MLRQTKKLDEYNRSRGNSRKVLKLKKAPKGLFSTAYKVLLNSEA